MAKGQNAEVKTTAKTKVRVPHVPKVPRKAVRKRQHEKRMTKKIAKQEKRINIFIEALKAFNIQWAPTEGRKRSLEIRYLKRKLQRAKNPQKGKR